MKGRARGTVDSFQFSVFSFQGQRRERFSVRSELFSDGRRFGVLRVWFSLQIHTPSSRSTRENQIALIGKNK